MTTLYLAWSISAGALLLLAIILAVGVGRGALGILIDARGRYSLTHFQIVLWTIVVISLISGVFWARLLDDPETALDFNIPGELLAILGISAGSTVAATVVKSHKDSQRPGEVAASDSSKKPSLKQIFAIEEGALADRAIDVTKFQSFSFTLIVAIAYVALCIGQFTDLASTSEVTSLPGFDTNFLTLLGISHAAYIAGKVPNREGTPDAPTARPLAEGSPH